jgi:hypothetical protein
MQISIDKIGSVTKNANIQHEEEISQTISAQEGLVVVGEVLEEKREYNQLELPSGRFSTLKKGDIVALALGNRRALKGFVGKIPEKLEAGDVIQVLNLAGVAGVCVSENVTEVGHAFPVRIQGVVIRDGKAVNIKDRAEFAPAEKLINPSPLIIISGTCMHVGKTSVASEIIAHASRHGMKIYATKMAGVASLKDVEKMKDYGAKKAISFLEAGLTSTVEQDGLAVKITKGAINYLSKDRPDFIVVELGDGVYGEYGVMEILEDLEIQANTAAHIGCAHDPMGAAKLAEVCEEIGLPLNAISGPVTDNSVGQSFISKNLGLSGFNAMYYNKELFKYVLNQCLKK